MSLLDDPALRLRATTRPAPRNGRELRVSFLPSSRYARDFAIPRGAEAEVRDRHTRGGQEVVSLFVVGVGYLTGVPADEVMAL